MSKTKHRPKGRNDRYTASEIWKAKRLWRAEVRRRMQREEYDALPVKWRPYGWP